MTSSSQIKLQLLSLKLVIFMLGFSAMLMQLLFISEIYAFFFANELILGVILSVWMLLVATGAWMGRFLSKYTHKIKYFSIVFFILTITPPLIITLLRFYRINNFFPGMAVDMPAILMTCLLFLSVYCVLSGLAFTALCSIFSNIVASNKINEVYYRETAGSVAGGLLFSFVLVSGFSSYDLLNILLMANLAVLCLWAFSNSLRLLFVASFILFVASNFLWLFNLDKHTKSDFFKNQEIIEDINTPYGNIIITQYAGQHNFFFNGSLMYSDNDVIRAEEKVHLTMFQKSDIKSVLLISGGVSGTINELLKYKGVSIDYVDFNPYLIDIAKKYNLMTDTEVNIIIQDPVMYLRSTENQYDVIIADIPEPLNAQLNRYYSLEFFKTIKKCMTASGVFSFALSSSGQYLNSFASQLHAVLYKTLSQVFNHIILVPAEQNFFVASQYPMSFNYEKLFNEKNIETVYANPFYLNDYEMETRSRRLKNELNLDVEVNTDYFPSAYLIQNKLWLSLSNHNIWFLFLFVFIIIAFMVLRFNPLNFCLFTGGLAATGIEVIIIIVFQIIYGYVYGSMGFIIALFMSGMALGAYIFAKIKYNNNAIMLALFLWLIAFLCVLLPLLIFVLKYIDINLVSKLCIYIYTLLFAVFVGAEFSVAVAIYKVNETKAASVLYSADMLGAALGGILFSAFLIPITGIYNCCFIITFVNLLSGFLIYFRRKKYI